VRALVLGVVVVAGLPRSRPCPGRIGRALPPHLPDVTVRGMGRPAPAGSTTHRPSSGTRALPSGWIEISLTHANWLPKFNLPDLFYDYLNYRQRIDDIGGT